jgi:putative membrane protein
MDYNYIKSLHIIFVVSWFAGLFYIVRLFIYTTEANQKAEPEKSILMNQLLLMQRKLLFIITWPAAVGTFIFGFWMLYLNVVLLSQPWMIVKLICIGLLALYHLQCHLIYTEQKVGIFKLTSFKLRLFNELATIFLVAIVFLVVVKSTNGLLWGMIGLFIFAVTLMTAVYLYKRQRKKKEEVEDKH